MSILFSQEKERGNQGGFSRKKEKRKFYAADKIAKEMLRAYDIQFDAENESHIDAELKKYYAFVMLDLDTRN